MKLSEEAREARNRYAREWKKRNPEKVKATLARYWEKKAATQCKYFSSVVKLHEQGLTVPEIASRLEKSELEVTEVLDQYNQPF